METCGICGSANIRGGSWTPDRCGTCGASKFTHTSSWEYDNEAQPSIAQIREESGYKYKRNFWEKPQWEVSYLISPGATIICEKTEIFKAWTKFGAWIAFTEYHKKNPITVAKYQENFSWLVMKKDIKKLN